MRENIKTDNLISAMSEVLTEITQLSELDCFHIVERHKTEFTYPLHRHREFELNFVEHGAGVRRIVGDSMETIGDYDLAAYCCGESGTCLGGRQLQESGHQGDNHPVLS